MLRENSSHDKANDTKLSRAYQDSATTTNCTCGFVVQHQQIAQTTYHRHSPEITPKHQQHLSPEQTSHTTINSYYYTKAGRGHTYTYSTLTLNMSLTGRRQSQLKLALTLLSGVKLLPLRYDDLRIGVALFHQLLILLLHVFVCLEFKRINFAQYSFFYFSKLCDVFLHYISHRCTRKDLINLNRKTQT